jgi:hypothetical protein
MNLSLSALIATGTGPDQLFIVVVFTGVAGGILVLCLAAFGGFLQEMLTGMGDLIGSKKKRGMFREPQLAFARTPRRKTHYMRVIAIGTLISFFLR